MGNFCPQCGAPHKHGAKFCQQCGGKLCAEPVQEQSQQYQQVVVSETQQQQVQQTMPPPTQPTPTQTISSPSLWLQNQYKIRKKVMTVGNKYWIEDMAGTTLGYCKQKLFKLKEDIRIYTDESLSVELFRIQQLQILDAMGYFAVADSTTNAVLGYVKRDIWSVIGKDAWEIQNLYQHPIGRLVEKSLGRAMARKYMPMGGLLPEKMQMELNGQVVADINQEFKVIGDIWTLTCYQIPPDVDRRVVLACMILMGVIERSRKGAWE